jgi:tetratricopeptide (TPR) repeat protein/DNA-binding CsgD family transcriptional regulator
MEKKEFTDLHDIYSNHLETINGIKFTPREIDMIACLTSGRSAKTIGSFLSISPKTVENHTRNIMQKLECNSREGIINFIEKSHKLSVVRKYYSILIIQSAFEEGLRKASILIKKEAPSFLIVYWRENENQDLFIHGLEKYLKLAGITVRIDFREKAQSFSKFIQETYSESHLICSVPPSWSTTIEKRENQQTGEIRKNILFLVPEREIPLVSQKKYTNLNYIDLSEHKNNYLLVFEILKKLFSNIDLERVTTEFKAQYAAMQQETISKGFSIYSEKKQIEKKKTSYFHKITGSLQKKKWAFLLILLLTSIFGGFMALQDNLSERKNGLQSQKQEAQTTPSIQSDLVLLTKNALLDRSSTITQIDDKFMKDPADIQIVALVGMGGAGKTTLSRQYARQQKGTVIWEINAETQGSLKGSFEDLAQALSVTEEDKRNLKAIQDAEIPAERAEKTIQFVKAHLKFRSNWFLIYDNIENFADIQKYFPHNSTIWGNGKILITTSDENICVNSIIPLGELNPDQKLNLFLNILGNGETQSFTLAQKEEAKKFLEEIPPFPLDVSIAAYYLKATHISYKKYVEYLKNYIEEFQNTQENILKETSHYTKTRHKIITLALKKLIETNKDFGDLFLFISLLNYQNIPRDLLTKYKSDVVVDSFIYNLKKFSLLINEQALSSHNILSIHRSTKDVALSYFTKTLNLEKNKSYLEPMALTLESYIKNAIEKENPSQLKRLISHCKLFLRHEHLASAVTGAIEGELGSLYYYIGDYIKAKFFLEDSLKSLNKYKREHDSLTAQVSVCLGIVYWELGDFEKAQTFLEKGLFIYKSYLPTNKVGTTKALSYLANVYSELGRYEEAIALFQESLVIYNKYLPENYASIAWTLTHLGNVYRQEEEFNKAKDCLEKALTIYKQHFPEHPGIARTSTYLGIIYSTWGNFEKAKNIFEQSLLIYKNHFDETHSGAAWTLTHLGNVYRKLGDLKKAKDLIQQALNIHKKLFEDDSIRTAWLYSCLGAVYTELGDFEKAEKILQKCLLAYKKNYGNKHIKTAQALRKLGKVYLLKGTLKTAENLLQKAFVIFQKHQSIEIYTVLEDLADLYLKKSALLLKEGNHQNAQASKEQARDFLRQALEIVSANFPEDSSHIARIQSRIKDIYE